MLRYKFLTYKQKEGQSFDEFMTQLKRLSSDCEFGELKNSIIKDIVVIGVTDDSLRERILREPNLTLERAIALGQSAEQTKIHAKELHWCHFRYFKWSHKQQPTNQHNRRGDKRRVVSHT